MKLENSVINVKKASHQTALLTDSVKKKALLGVATMLLKNEGKILNANLKDIDFAKKKGLSSALIDRLTLNSKRVEGMANAVKEIAGLPDPNGEIVSMWETKDGLEVQKVRVPLGVIAMVYESRPNVTVESAALALKAGNAVILRGGSEAIHSNKILSFLFQQAVSKVGVPAEAILFIDNLDRNNIYKLARMDQWIDLLIARGAEKMMQDIRAHATVPVLGHGKGVCHIYIDKDADLDMAKEIAINAKVQRPGVCNAMETLLVHKAVANKFLPEVSKEYKKAGVVLKGDKACREIVPSMEKATEKDWETEYLDLILSIKVVDSLDEAMGHIRQYSSGHTEAIITKNKKSAEEFLRCVDSAAVFHNTSTRMHDGGVFGLGAEIGISTQKLHARGTMGVRELTTTKYIVFGKGQIRK